MPFCYNQLHCFNHGGFWYLPPTVLLSVLHIQVEPQIPQQSQMLSTHPVLWVTSIYIPLGTVFETPVQTVLSGQHLECIIVIPLLCTQTTSGCVNPLCGDLIAIACICWG